MSPSPASITPLAVPRSLLSSSRCSTTMSYNKEDDQNLCSLSNNRLNTGCRMMLDHHKGRLLSPPSIIPGPPLHKLLPALFPLSMHWDSISLSHKTPTTTTKSERLRWVRIEESSLKRDFDRIPLSCPVPTRPCRQVPSAARPGWYQRGQQ